MTDDDGGRVTRDHYHAPSGIHTLAAKDAPRFRRRAFLTLPSAPRMPPDISLIVMAEVNAPEQVPSAAARFSGTCQYFPTRRGFTAHYIGDCRLPVSLIYAEIAWLTFTIYYIFTPLGRSGFSAVATARVPADISSAELRATFLTAIFPRDVKERAVAFHAFAMPGSARYDDSFTARRFRHTVENRRIDGMALPAAAADGIFQLWSCPSLRLRPPPAQSRFHSAL